MGINHRYALALLALIPALSLGAVRTKVPTSSSDIIRSPASTSLSPDFQTPNGAVHYYGPEKYYSLDPSLNAQPGTSIGPTVRPVSGPTIPPAGSTSFPYGPGAYTGGNTNTVIKVKPKVVVPKSRPYAKLKNLIKVSPAQIAGSAFVGAAVAGVGWIIDNGSVLKQDKKETAGPTDYRWSANTNAYWGTNDIHGKPYPSPFSGCNAFVSTWTAANAEYWRATSVNTQKVNETAYTCNIDVASVTTTATSKVTVTFNRSGNSCTSPAYYDSTAAACVTTGLFPITDSDLSSLDPWLNNQTAEWLSGLIREQCNGSPNPSACFDDMRDFSQDTLTGPATAAGPSTTRTTSTSNPDGTTSTTTQNTTTNYTFNYGSNYFDTSTTTTTTTSKDGLPVSTETQQDTTTPTDTPEPEPEPDYSFSDSPMPDVPSFYTQKYPDGLSGVWNDAKSGFEQSDFMTFLHSFVPSFSGTCPTWSMSFSIGRMVSLGSHEFANLCYVFDFIKVIMLLGAVFLSRALIFGG